MSDSNVRSDAVDVEQIMRQIRARVREKHGSAYTDAELQQLAAARLDALLDPRGNRGELVAEFRKRVTTGSVTDFSEEALYDSHRGWIKSLRKLLNPILKLFINPGAFSRAMQARHQIDGLIYEVVQNLVVENTRLSLEVQNLKMRAESLSTRMDFDVRRAKALENVPPSRPIQQDRPQERQQDRQYDRQHDRQRHQGRGPDRFRQGPQGPQGSQGPQISQSPQSPPVASQSPQGLQAPQGLPAAQSPQGSQVPQPQQLSQAGPGQMFPGSDGQTGGGESRRRRRRRRRRRGQGPQGQGPQGQPGAQSSQGPQGPQGSQGSANSQNAMDASDDGDDRDDGGDGFEDGDEGASDQ